MPEGVRTLLADVSLRIIELAPGEFINNFAQAAGEILKTDMLLVSRVKSKDAPVETYALYDRSGHIEYYTYPIAGTPCETVVDGAKPFSINCDVVKCFPEDKDLETIGLQAYAGVPLFDNAGKSIGLIAGLWRDGQGDLDLEMKVLEYFAPLVAKNMVDIEASERNALSVEGAASGAWYLDFESGLEYFSKAARRVLQCPSMPDCAPIYTFFDTLAPEDKRLLRASLAAYHRGDAPYDINFQITDRTGRKRWIRIAGKARRNLEGRIVAMGGDVSDISQMVEARRKAEAASQAKSTFLATMSHEIRTPMNGVMGMAALLCEADLPKEQHHQAQVIKKSGETMMTILNDVLDLSKIEAGKLDLESREFSPRDLVSEVVDLWSSSVGAKGLTLNVNVDETIPEKVKGDEMRLRQVLSNLMSNALKFTEEGSISIGLSADCDNDTARLRFVVEDSGIGMDKVQQAALFSAFSQADRTIARRFGGTGLGLAISDKIVRLMGGGFDVSSTPGEGTCFAFTISCPLVETGKTKSKKEKPADDAKNSQKKQSIMEILVAEDNEINRTVIQAFLSRLPVKLSFAHNGKEALDLASERPYDVILMDIQMPIMGGIEAVRMLRAQDGPCQNTPVIALTANAMDGDRQRYIDAGMDDYVTKPIEPQKLFQAIKKARQGRQAQVKGAPPASDAA